jgi:hypothetical protein
MSKANSTRPWRALAARAAVHLGAARLLIDLALDGEPPESTAQHLRGAQAETVSAQGLVREISSPAVDFSVPRLALDLAKEGMAWWNALSESERAAALEAANTDVPAEAWARYKRAGGLS